jgi:hypothetical protein
MNSNLQDDVLRQEEEEEYVYSQSAIVDGLPKLPSQPKDTINLHVLEL